MLADVTWSISSSPVNPVAYETSPTKSTEKCVHLIHGVGPSVNFFVTHSITRLNMTADITHTCLTPESIVNAMPDSPMERM